MKLYRLVEDGERYGTLVFDGDLLRESLGWKVMLKLSSLTTDIADKWPQINGWFHSLYEDKGIDDKPDVFVTAYAWLVLSSKARALLEPVLYKAGEFLPFDCDGEAYYLLVPHVIIPVDENLSEYNFVDGDHRGTKKVVFRPEEVGVHTLFKTDFDYHLNLFCSEKFKSLVEMHKLTGVHFDEQLAKAVD